MIQTQSDSELEQWVLRELSLSEKICSREICVLAQEGVVSLRGSVPNDEDKLTIEQATRRAFGVLSVVNELRVKSLTALSEKEIGAVLLPELQPSVSLMPLTSQLNDGKTGSQEMIHTALGHARAR